MMNNPQMAALRQVSCQLLHCGSKELTIIRLCKKTPP
jgi:hypothetical protein